MALSASRRRAVLALTVLALALLGAAGWWYASGHGAAEPLPPQPAHVILEGGAAAWAGATGLARRWPDTSRCTKWPQYGRALITRGCKGGDPETVGGGGYRCVDPQLTTWSSCQFEHVSPARGSNV